MADLSENDAKFTPNETKPFSEIGTSYTYFADNDVLLAKVTPCFENGKAGIAKNLENSIGFGSSEYIVLRADKSKVLPEYIYFNIASDIFRHKGKPAMTGTGGLQRVPKSFIENYSFPLPPLETQKEIVAEFAREQKIADANKELIKIYEAKINSKISEIWSE